MAVLQPVVRISTLTHPHHPLSIPFAITTLAATYIHTTTPFAYLRSPLIHPLLSQPLACWDTACFLHQRASTPGHSRHSLVCLPHPHPPYQQPPFNPPAPVDVCQSVHQHHHHLSFTRTPHQQPPSCHQARPPKAIPLSVPFPKPLPDSQQPPRLVPQHEPLNVHHDELQRGEEGQAR